MPCGGGGGAHPGWLDAGMACIPAPWPGSPHPVSEALTSLCSSHACILTTSTAMLPVWELCTNGRVHACTHTHTHTFPDWPVFMAPAACVQGGDEGLAARLLQALRWRLAHAPPGAARWHLLAAWVEVDLLDCHASDVAEGEMPHAHAQSVLQVRARAWAAGLEKWRMLRDALACAALHVPGCFGSCTCPAVIPLVTRQHADAWPPCSRRGGRCLPCAVARWRARRRAASRTSSRPMPWAATTYRTTAPAACRPWRRCCSAPQRRHAMRRGTGRSQVSADMLGVRSSLLYAYNRTHLQGSLCTVWLDLI